MINSLEYHQIHFVCVIYDDAFVHPDYGDCNHCLCVQTSVYVGTHNQNY